MRFFPRRPKCSFCGCFILLILAGVIFVGYYFYKEVGKQIKWRDVLSVFIEKQKIKIEQRTKDKLKKEGKELENEIYKQATEHNPKGDLLPDQIDDNIKKELKKDF